MRIFCPTIKLPLGMVTWTLLSLAGCGGGGSSSSTATGSSSTASAGTTQTAAEASSPAAVPSAAVTSAAAVTPAAVVPAPTSVTASASGAAATAAPTGLAASAASARVNLVWNAVAGASGYHVKRSLTSGGSYTQIAAATSATYADGAVSVNTTYFYVVSATTASGESGDSAQVSAEPLAVAKSPTPVQLPGLVSSLKASAGNAQVTLSWAASTAATGYHVKRALTNGGPYTVVGSATATTMIDTGLANNTTYYYVLAATDSAGDGPNSAQVSAMPAAASAALVNVTVTVSAGQTHPISPYIYGINDYAGNASGQPNLTFDRAGGNRWTAYNWETNASNAGSDYQYENDNYLTGSTVAGNAVTKIIAGDQAQGMATLVTFQMQGLVAADENGPVSVAGPPDMSRFKTVVDQKNSQSGMPFTTTPSAADANVYMDEFIWSLDHAFAGLNIFGANPTAHPVFAQLDNEPELWNSTHLEVQGRTLVSSDAYIAKTISLSRALKTQFPSLVVFGAVHYGFQGIFNWQGELGSTPSGNNWFPDKFLAAIKTASSAFGRPLVDVYDFHWYSEATDGSGNRVVDMNGSTLTAAQVQAIVQSPRSLWDIGYSENSWISQELGGPIYLVGRLQAKIAATMPGMKVSITEYNNGGGNHIAGTIAEADNLGIFGAQGLFAANYWALNNNSPYILAGFAAFRGFDGASANFGDTSLQAVSSNVQNVAVYASTDSNKPGRVVYVAINRSTSPQVTAIVGQALSGTAHLYQMSAASAQAQSKIKPVSAGSLAVSGSSLTITLPALSVTTVDVF